MFRSLASLLLATAVNAAAADYSENGANWTGLCEYGREQSPINLQEALAEESDKMEINGYGYYDF